MNIPTHPEMENSKEVSKHRELVFALDSGELGSHSLFITLVAPE